MSTRGAIARLNGNGGFKGVYNHFDSYPEGLGRTLFKIYREVFNKDLKAMTKFLIDDHPAGWSTINGCDFSLPAGYRMWPNNNTPCKACGKENWRHYRQYYKEMNEELPPPESWSKENEVLVLGHGFVCPEKPPTPPQCYCHGERHEEAWEITEKNASSSGIEWVYAFNEEKNEMHILASYYDPNGKFAGKKMIGMFGFGDPNAVWKTVVVVDLNGDEPDWERIKA